MFSWERKSNFSTLKRWLTQLQSLQPNPFMGRPLSETSAAKAHSIFSSVTLI